MGEAVEGFSLSNVGVEIEGARLLSGITLELPTAHWSALVGPSGSGKSTLLRLLNRLLEPCEGEVRFAGKALPDYDVRALRRRVGLVVQQPQLSAGTARTNLELPVRLGVLDAAQAAQRLPEAIEVACLEHKLLDRDVSALSGGERQRVALARAWMLRPDVLLLDEPTSALDPDTARRVLAGLEALRAQRGLTLVVVTHRIEDLTRLSADAHCAVLAEGRLVESATAQQVLTHPQSATARLLLGESPGAPSGRSSDARAD